MDIPISRDGTLWAIGGDVVNLTNGTATRGIEGVPLAFSPDGKRLATVSVGPNRDMLLWDVGSQRALPRLESFCRNGIYNSDWTQIITIGAIGAQVWTMPPVAVSP